MCFLALMTPNSTIMWFRLRTLYMAILGPKPPDVISLFYHRTFITTLWWLLQSLLSPLSIGVRSMGHFLLEAIQLKGFVANESFNVFMALWANSNRCHLCVRYNPF